MNELPGVEVDNGWKYDYFKYRLIRLCQYERAGFRGFGPRTAFQ